MFSGDLMRRYFRYFILIVSIAVVVMGFLWLNFLYTKHQRELVSLEEAIVLSLQEEAKSKSHELRLRGEDIRNRELVALERLLEYQAALVRAGVYDVYFTHDDLSQRQVDISRLLKNLSLGESLSIYLKTEDFSLGEGLALDGTLDLGINHVNDKVVFFNRMVSPNFEFYIYVTQDEYINSKLEESFIDFALWDANMYLKDNQDRLILPLDGYHLDDGFFHEEYSEKTSYTYGYFISKDIRDQVLEGRNELFESFLISHIFEIIGLLLIFSITSFVIYRQGIIQLEQHYSKLNDQILDAFRNNLSLSHSPDFQLFALSDSYDSILRESRLMSEEYEKKIAELSQELKKNKLERLLLERKIMRLSELPFTKDILYNYRVESFSPKKLIEEIHDRIDPTQDFELLGSSETIRSDVGLFTGLVEEIFKLSRDEKRSYSVRIVRDAGQMLIYFTLKGMETIPEDKMQELKNRAKLLDGVFLRHQSERQTLHLVLSLYDVRNEEI